MHTHALTIGVAETTDLADASAILMGAAEWLLTRGIRQWKPEDFSTAAVSRWLGELHLAREPAGKAVGVFRLVDEDRDIWPDADPETAALVLHSLAVAAAYRGSGVGAALLRGAADIARSRGAAVLRLDCWSGNQTLRAYYEAQEFTYLDDLDVGAYSCSRYERTLL